MQWQGSSTSPRCLWIFDKHFPEFLQACLPHDLDSVSAFKAQAQAKIQQFQQIQMSPGCCIQFLKMRKKLLAAPGFLWKKISRLCVLQILLQPQGILSTFIQQGTQSIARPLHLFAGNTLFLILISNCLFLDNAALSPATSGCETVLRNCATIDSNEIAAPVNGYASHAHQAHAGCRLCPTHHAGSDGAELRGWLSLRFPTSWHGLRIVLSSSM